MNEDDRKQAQAVKKEKRKAFRCLAVRALPEIRTFQMFTKLTIMLLTVVLAKIVTRLLESTSDGLVTTAILTLLFRSWQGLLALVLGFFAVLIYIAMDLLAQITLCDNILEGRPTETFRTLKRGFETLPKFLTPAGLPVILFIFLAVPLVGIGFGISLTRSVYVPSFIMDVILSTPVYLIVYIAGLLILLWLLLRYQFTLHGVMIDGLTVRDAKKQSVRFFRANWRDVMPRMLLAFLEVLLIGTLVGYIVSLIPALLLIPETQDDLLRRFLILFALAALALIMTVTLNDDILRPADVGYVPHRAGGTMASENSLDGLEAAIEHGAYGSEIDVQRTKDGFYIINHDGTFKRLAGESRAPEEMTFEEVRALTFEDTTGNGKMQTVPTLEEMLDTIKGREKLFI